MRKQKSFLFDPVSFQHALAFALEKMSQGERVRVNFASNGGFHSFAEWPVILYGPSVRNPMSREEIENHLSNESYNRRLERVVEINKMGFDLR